MRPTAVRTGAKDRFRCPEEPRYPLFRPIRSGRETAGGTDHGLDALLVLAPELHGHSRLSAFRVLAPDRAVHGQRVPGQHGLDEGDSHLAALNESLAQNCTIICDTYAVDIMPCAS